MQITERAWCTTPECQTSTAAKERACRFSTTFKQPVCSGHFFFLLSATMEWICELWNSVWYLRCQMAFSPNSTTACHQRRLPLQALEFLHVFRAQARWHTAPSIPLCSVAEITIWKLISFLQNFNVLEKLHNVYNNWDLTLWIVVAVGWARCEFMFILIR